MRKQTILPAGLCLLLTGCGYTSKARLPEGIETISIPIFRNQTFYRDIELELAQALRKEVVAKTHLRLTDSSRANSALEGEITDFNLIRLKEDLDNRVTEFSVTFQVDIAFKDLRTNKEIYSVKELSRRAEFQVGRGEDISKARAEAIREMAREIVLQILNRW